MEDKRRDSKKSRQFGFVELLIECCTMQSIPGFTCTLLPHHPFGLRYGQRNLGIVFVGNGATEESLRGFVRLIGWEISNQCLGSHHPVELLRVIRVPRYGQEMPTPKYDLYYEVGVGCHLYMAGGWNYYSTASKGAHQLEELFRFLSHTYGVPVNQYDANSRHAQYLEDEFPQVLDDSYRESERIWDRDLKEQVNWTTFSTGQRVTFTDKGYVTIKYSFSGALPATQTFVVENVETVPDYCSCGLGDSKSFIVSFHPERCNLRRRHEMTHHQLVTVRLGEKAKKVTGFYLKHV